MVDEYVKWQMEESSFRRNRMSRDRFHSGHRVETDGFRCHWCGQYVLRDPLFSGVINRNHCPYCLWSRHLDWRKPGDRMSACKGKMQPVGLAQKQKRNHYSRQIGELMLIHICEDCGQVSTNRIAADDQEEEIWKVFASSINLIFDGWLLFQDEQMDLLNSEHADLVSRCLFGVEKPAEGFPRFEQSTCQDGLILTE
jgi:hypothetical protein